MTRPTIGEEGRALTIVSITGDVEINGTRHSARVAKGEIAAGSRIVVTGFDPPQLLVKESIAESQPETSKSLTEQATATVAPLADPLRVIRQVIGWFLIIALLAAGLSVAFAKSLLFLNVLLGLPVLFFVWRLLPNHPVNAFYLRAFRNDRKSWPIRKAAQTALGNGFRLSGIREPRLRWHPFVRGLVLTLFVLRYCTPKFMNLEAGRDWKARLWRSLADARCALIDVTDLTPFVEDEIRLAYRCLGLSRMLFIGNLSRSVGEWQRTITALLNAGLDPTSIRMAIWDDTSADIRKDFALTVEFFRSHLPKGTAGINQDAFQIAMNPASLPERDDAGRSGFIWYGIAGMAMATIAVQFLEWHLQQSANSPLHLAVAVVPLVGLNGYLFVLLIGYLIDCASNRERVVTMCTFLLIPLPPALLLPAIAKVQGAAQRAMTTNQLRQVGIGFLIHDDEGRLALLEPADASGKPLLSWRVGLLPCLGAKEKALYREFKLNEAWDSRHNTRLLHKMPELYKSASGDRSMDAGLTHFRVFRGTDVNLSRMARLTGMKRVLVVDAKEAVPWTKPDRIDLGDTPIEPQLGSSTNYDGYHLLFDDAFVAYVRKGRLTESVLLSLILGRAEALPAGWDQP